MDSPPPLGELLDPRHEVVPFHGRERELAALARWRDGAGTRSALLLHGPAGVGKTRLALRFAAGGGVRVVDDADLLPWQDVHHQVAAGGCVLLTARGTGWWWSATCRRAADVGCATAELEVTAQPDEHAASFAAACAHFADALGRTPPDAAPTHAAPTFAPTFHDLHLAALTAVCGSPVDPAAGATRGRLAEDVLATVLLDERITPDDTPRALETLVRAADRWPHVRRRAQELFTSRPDLAATATVGTLRALAESPAVARVIARRVFDDPRFHGDTLPAVLTRTLLHDRAATAGTVELAELHGALAARAALAALRDEAVDAARHEVSLYRVLTAEDPAEHRSALADALGDLALRLVAVDRPEDAVAASEEAVARWREVVADDEDCTPQLAAALDLVSRRYAALGRREEAVTAIAEACALYEEHAALFGRDLARATRWRAVVEHGTAAAQSG